MSIEPGTYTRHELGNEEYHADETAVSKSGLDLIRRSPAHFRQARLDRSAGLVADSPALRIGSATHSLVLEPDTFWQEWAVAPSGIDRRTKAGKAAWAEFEESVGARGVLTAGEGELVARVAEAVRAHPAAKELLKKGEAEQTAVWDDFMTGARCKCRPDWLTKRGRHLLMVDLKTALNASFAAFRKAVIDRRYHAQAAFYMDGWKEATGAEVASFLVIAVEKEPPYAVAVYQLEDELVELGRAEIGRDLALYASCVERGEWPAYGDEVEAMGLPPWMEKKSDE